MTTETAAKRNTQKLQRAIVDGLEDVKAQDIQVFDTEHLSSLFERVIVASGTSNRQTKALAASVRDAVREAGFPKPRIEGEANGEWIIVDCAQAVVHIMQPTFRSYYHLEELWGEKPVRLKFGAGKPVAAAPEKKPAIAAAPAKGAARKAGSGKAAVTRTAAPTSRPVAKRAATPAVPAAPDSPKPKVKTVVVPKPAPKSAPKSAPKAANKAAIKSVAGARPGAATPARPAARKTPVRKP